MNFLSKNFSFEELTRTDVKELQTQNRVEALLYLPSIRRGAVTLLQPIRQGTGLKMTVNSGFRGRTLNARVGGSLVSQHCLGEAFDFNCKGFEDRYGQLLVMKWIVDANIPFGQLLLERGCIHISLPRSWAASEVAEYDVPTKTKKTLDLSRVSLRNFPPPHDRAA